MNAQSESSRIARRTKIRELTFALALAMLIGTGLAVRAAGDSNQTKVPELPRPSGPFGVGRVFFDWTDPGRPPEMMDDVGTHAEIMVYLWYPTSHPAPGAKSVLFPGAKRLDSGVSSAMKENVFGGNWSAVASEAISSHAEESAKIAPNPKTFPVILFSPGAYGSTFQYSSAIEDLVSHGYVVAAIEHTSEVFAVAFPDGRLHFYSPQKIPKESMPPSGATKEQYQEYLETWYRHCVDVRARDTSFVIDKLTELNRGANYKSQFRGRFDLDRLAAVGHSRGGWSAILSCRRDERLRACVNEDGNAGGQGLQYPGAAPPKQSILYVEISPVLKPGTTEDDWIVLKQLHLTANEWVERWHNTVTQEFQSFPAGGYFVQLKAPGLEHYSFSDEVILRSAREGVKDRLQTALHNLQLTENVTRAFLDDVLKNEKQEALHDTSEMTVRHFGQ